MALDEYIGKLRYVAAEADHGNGDWPWRVADAVIESLPLIERATLAVQFDEMFRDDEGRGWRSGEYWNLPASELITSMLTDMTVDWLREQYPKEN